MKYKYELHCHTSLVSRCASIDAPTLVKLYKANGYTGVFVTDHFLNGNTVVDRSLPWKRQIEEYAKGYYTCKNEGEKIGLDVFFGVESSYKGTDVLFYGLMPDWYEKHPEIMQMSMKDSILFVRENGGIAVQAHPYRRDGYIDHVRLFAEYCDGLEVYNANRKEVENSLANTLADAYGLIKTSGSDLHSSAQENLGGMAFNEKIKDEKHLLKLLKEGSGSIIKQKNVLNSTSGDKNND